MNITLNFLKTHPNHIFVFGDNMLHKGCKGAALFRNEPNVHGFITKRFPNNKPKSFFRPHEYEYVFKIELLSLEKLIKTMSRAIWLITPLGSGLANKYHIWEKVIKPGLEELRKYPNVIFTWEVDKI